MISIQHLCYASIGTCYKCSGKKILRKMTRAATWRKHLKLFHGVFGEYKLFMKVVKWGSISWWWFMPFCVLIPSGPHNLKILIDKAPCWYQLVSPGWRCVISILMISNPIPTISLSSIIKKLDKREEMVELWGIPKTKIFSFTNTGLNHPWRKEENHYNTCPQFLTPKTTLEKYHDQQY